MKIREKLINLYKNNNIKNLDIGECFNLIRYAERIYNSKYYIFIDIFDNKMDKYLKKISIFYKYIKDLIHLLSNDEYNDLINNCKIRFIPQEKTSIYIKPLSYVLNDYYKDAEKLIRIINKDENLKSKISHYSYIKKTFSCHVELNIIKELTKIGITNGYIGCSKYSCYLCNIYINKLNELNYNFYSRGSNNKICSSWLYPSIKNLGNNESNRIKRYLNDNIFKLVNGILKPKIHILKINEIMETMAL